MNLVFVDVGKAALLTLFVAPDLTLKLYSNDRAPVIGDIASNYIEVSGGGYASKTLQAAHWNLSGSTPMVATYDTPQDWDFTSTIDDSGVAFGYYLVNGGGVLIAAKRFTSGGFTPQQFSRIRVHPAYTLDNRP
jgi:hypothetical protein